MAVQKQLKWWIASWCKLTLIFFLFTIRARNQHFQNWSSAPLLLFTKLIKVITLVDFFDKMWLAVSIDEFVFLVCTKILRSGDFSSIYKLTLTAKIPHTTFCTQIQFWKGLHIVYKFHVGLQNWETFFSIQVPLFIGEKIHWLWIGYTVLNERSCSLVS